MKGTIVFWASANAINWLNVALLLTVELNPTRPEWYVAWAPGAGLIAAFLGVLLVLIGDERPGARIVGIVILVAATIVGYVMIGFAFGSDWNTNLVPVLPVILTVHILWTLSPLAGFAIAMFWPGDHRGGIFTRSLSSRMPTALAWTPTTFLMTFAVTGVVVGLAQGEFATVSQLGQIAVGSLLGLVGAAVIAALIGVFLVRGRPWYRTVVWVLALPPRALGWVLTGLLRLTTRFFLPAMMILGGIAVAIGLAVWMSSNSVAVWLIVIIVVVACTLTVGGTVWANQYGSGISGGFPLWILVCGGVFVIGVVTWLGLAAAIGLGMAAPVGTVWWLYLGANELGARRLDLVLPAAIAVVSFLPPLLSDLGLFSRREG